LQPSNLEIHELIVITGLGKTVTASGLASTKKSLRRLPEDGFSGLDTVSDSLVGVSTMIFCRAGVRTNQKKTDIPTVADRPGFV